MSNNYSSVYFPPFYLRSGHLQTVYPSIYRKIGNIGYDRERISTPDDDFLDLDWSCVGSKTLAIISHGLEGNSNRSYVKGMVKALNSENIDCLGWNFRSCGGETNRQLIMYHNGATYDLETVIQHAIKTDRYDRLFLVGFSMGGNLSLLYAGEKAENILPQIKGIITFSVPCDLGDSAVALSKWSSRVYMKRFLVMLHEKIKAKIELFPDLINDTDYDQLKSFKDFDDRYTAPLHGFENAEDYWAKCSSRRLLTKIMVPSLIVNSADDPFLLDGCYPHFEVAKNPLVKLEIPKYGGHVGFVQSGSRYWSEDRTVQFIQGIIS